MQHFLTNAKKALWRSGRRVTPAYLQSLEVLLLENLSVLGEITEDDRLWAKEAVQNTFPR
jgi:hypothetical protein